MRRMRRGLLLAALVAAAGWTAYALRPPGKQGPPARFGQPTVEVVAGMVAIPAGQLVPTDVAHPITTQGRPIAPFWIDRHEVTNRQFAEFVDATGYVTTAERVGWGHVFDPTLRQWRKVERATWRRPGGPFTSTAGRENYPVVMVSWHDAVAYARWAGKRLPTADEWEYAARGGQYDTVFPWGREERPAGQYMANYWQGWFPDEDLGHDGYRDLAPVGSFPTNPYGLHDMAGNVWEWCADWEAESPSDAARRAPPTRRVRRGGSWLCSENYSRGIEVATRSAAGPAAASNHTGFRCVQDTRPTAAE